MISVTTSGGVPTKNVPTAGGLQAKPFRARAKTRVLVESVMGEL